LKHWVGINPVILTQKNQFFETLAWYQPSDFSPKKSPSVSKNCFFGDKINGLIPTSLSKNLFFWGKITGLIPNQCFKKLFFWG
jgi:hypothetical protein